jgi:hypothetical protein
MTGGGNLVDLHSGEDHWGVIAELPHQLAVELPVPRIVVATTQTVPPNRASGLA